jgi:CheY-like chemotaxis protein
MSASGPSVLWAEDSAEDRYLIRDALREIRYTGEVSFVEDGREALEALDSWLPGRVVLDIGMPRMSGLEALRQLRARPDSAKVPVSVFTGRQDPGLEQTCRGLGVDPFVSKPIHLPAFNAAVATALALPRGTQTN